MFTRLFSTIVGAGIGFAVTAVPAYAADDIEAKVQMCDACHGQNGVPADPKTIPIIWGQQQSYLVKQLRDYRNGERDNPIMSPIAKALAQEDLRKIAAYFAAKSWPAQQCDRRSRRRRPTESPSASHAISPILRAARRRRGWRGSATNTWSQRCATSPPMKGPTTATCRNSCKR